MIFLHKIDDNGMFLEDCLLPSIPLNLNGHPDAHYVRNACQPGFYMPRWDGLKWVEGGTKPETSVTTLIEQLKAQLSETNNQAIAYAEGALTAEEYAPMKAQRQAWRDEINRLEQEGVV